MQPALLWVQKKKKKKKQLALFFSVLTEAPETSCRLASMEGNTSRGKYNWAFYRTLREFRKSAFPTFYLPRFNRNPTYYDCIEKEEIKENYHFYFHLEAHPSIGDESGLKETGESCTGCFQPTAPTLSLPHGLPHLALRVNSEIGRFPPIPGFLLPALSLLSFPLPSVSVPRWTTTTKHVLNHLWWNIIPVSEITYISLVITKSVD